MSLRFLAAAILASTPLAAAAQTSTKSLQQEAKDAQRRLDELTKQLMNDPYSAMPEATLPSGKKVSARRYMNLMLQGIPAEGPLVTPAHMRTTGGKKSLKLEWSVDVVGSTFLPGPDVRLSNSELVFAGVGSENALGGMDLTGKTLIVITDDGGISRGIRTNRADLTRQWRIALDRGAAAVLWVTSNEPALSFWDSMRATWAGVNQAAEFRDAQGRPLYPLQIVGILSHKGVLKIFANAGVDFDSSVVAANQPGFRAFSLPMSASMSVRVLDADEFDPVNFKIPD